MCHRTKVLSPGRLRCELALRAVARAGRSGRPIGQRSWRLASKGSRVVETDQNRQIEGVPCPERPCVPPAYSTVLTAFRIREEQVSGPIRAQVGGEREESSSAWASRSD